MKKFMLCGAFIVSLSTLGAVQSVRAQETEKRATTDTYEGNLRPVVGAKYKFRSFSRHKMVGQYPASAPGEPVVVRKGETVEITKFDYDYEVVSVDNFGNHQARITYGEFTSDRNVFVDGKSSPQQMTPPMKAEVNRYLKLVKGASFLIKVSQKNEILAVYGLDVVRARIYKGLETASPELREAIKVAVEDMLNIKKADQKFLKWSGQLPPYPVRVSESWDYQFPVASSVSFVPEIHGKRTLVSLTDGIAAIKDVAAFEAKRTPKNRLGQQTTRTMSATGLQNVTFHINNATGMPIDSTGTQVTKGTVSAPYGPQRAVISLPFSVTKEFRIVFEEQS